MTEKITSLIHEYRFVLALSGALFVFVFGAMGLVLVSGESVEPTDSHVVSLYVDGQEYTIPTRAKNVGELIDNSGIEVREGDSIEPARETKIEVDQFRVRVIRARPYVVRDGGKEYSALSAHTSARLIAEAAGLSLKPADQVEFAPIEEVALTEIGRVVEVVRSKQITFGLYGSIQQIHTNASTVEELLSEVSLVLNPGDELSLPIQTPITEGMSLFVNRNGVTTVTEEVAVPSPIEYVEDLSLTMGSSVVREPGKEGKRIVSYEVRTQNGVEISRTEISSAIVEQPTTKVVARGRAAGQIVAEREQIMALAGIPASEYAAVNYIIGQESGWCATKWQGQYGACPAFYEERHSPSDSRYGYGLCQSTPAIKMATMGADWQTNAVAQLKWCYNYMLQYGSATAAADFKQCLGQCYSPRTNSVVTKRTTWF